MTDENQPSAAVPVEDARRSDELASRLAYEWNMRLVEDALRTLEAQRTRAVALLSVAIIALGIAVSVTSSRQSVGDLGCLGIVGWIVFAAGIVLVAGSAAAVAWPIKTNAALDPASIIANYVVPQDPLRSPDWVHQMLSRDLRNGYDSLERTLRIRNLLYRWSIASMSAILLGAGLVWLDARL